MKTIAILGGRGKAGQDLVRSALERNYRVVALQKTKTETFVPHQNLQILYGDATNPDDIKALLQGVDFVVNAVGKKITDPPFYLEITRQIEAVSRTGPIARYILISNAALRAQGDRRTVIQNIMSSAMAFLFRDFMRDRQNELSELQKSDLNWTIVRLPILVKRPAPRAMKYHESQMTGSFVDPQNVAGFILDEIENLSLNRKCVFLSD